MHHDAPSSLPARRGVWLYPEPMTERTIAFTLKQAAEEAGVSRDTIKRRNAAGEFPNAYQDHRGVWMIPLTDLLAAGLPPKLRQGDTQVQLPDAPGERPMPRSEFDTKADELEERLEQAQAEADALRVRLDLLDLEIKRRDDQVRYEQQLRQAVESHLSTLQKQIEAPVVAPAASPSAPSAETPRRRWWQF
jgi:hypothetical protein